jgi:hypothetical protein
MQLGFTNKSFIPKLVVVVGICGFLYGFFSNRRTTYETKTYWFHVPKNIESKVNFDDKLETTKLETTIEQVDTETPNDESTNNESTNNESTNINEVE